MENFNTFIEETARQGATDLLFKKKIEFLDKELFCIFKLELLAFLRLFFD